ncbi:hypothetical protein IRB23SM22_11430 [Alkalibacterium sp. s-m-22]
MTLTKHIKYWISFIVIWLLVVLILLYVSDNANGFFAIVLCGIFSWIFMSYIDDIRDGRKSKKTIRKDGTA